jgi:hypothetical protein
LNPFDPNAQPVDVTIGNVAQDGINTATGALLTFNVSFGGDPAPSSFNVLVNGNSHTITSLASQSYAVPIPLSEIRAGTNKVTLPMNTVPIVYDNFDLILVGGGGVPSCINPSACGSSPPPPQADAGSGPPDAGGPMPDGGGVAGQSITFGATGLPLDATFTGQYPNGLIAWGAGWFLSSPWQALTTASLTFDGPGISSASFSSLVPAHVVSLGAYNGAPRATTVQISCPGQAPVTQTVAAQGHTTIATGWTASCSPVTIQSDNGWDTAFDNMVVAQP